MSAHAATENNVRRASMLKYIEHLRGLLQLPPSPISDQFISIPVENPTVLMLHEKHLPEHPGVEFRLYTTSARSAYMLSNALQEISAAVQCEPVITLSRPEVRKYELSFFVPEKDEQGLLQFMEQTQDKLYQLLIDQGKNKGHSR